MKSAILWLGVSTLLALTPSASIHAQTPGTARLTVTLADYNGSSQKHWTVVWVTTSSGAFIKTLWRQGPSITSSHWDKHCHQWYAAKNGSTAFDGYSSATAKDYTGVNNPVVVNWDCRDASGRVVPDGTYKFWVQYAEDNGQGPYTTSGLAWTKSSSPETFSYPDQSPNFSHMQVVWTPAGVPPQFTSDPPPATATVGVPYDYTLTASGTGTINFFSSGLPPGLTLSRDGRIQGIPTTPGMFAVTILAVNGINPSARLTVSIEVDAVPARFVGLELQAEELILHGHGPAHGMVTLETAPRLEFGETQWTAIATNQCADDGTFAFTNALGTASAARFYRLRIP